MSKELIFFFKQMSIRMGVSSKEPMNLSDLITLFPTSQFSPSIISDRSSQLSLVTLLDVICHIMCKLERMLNDHSMSKMQVKYM